jgi:predicted RNA-binding protein YlqC (UPF0109 family)
MSFHSRGASSEESRRHPARETLTSAESAALVQLTEAVVSACVREPQAVEVSYDQRRDRLLIEVASRDRGSLIGSGGRNLRALEDVLLLALRYQRSDQRSIASALPMLELSSRRDQAR